MGWQLLSGEPRLSGAVMTIACGESMYVQRVGQNGHKSPWLKRFMAYTATVAACPALSTV